MRAHDKATAKRVAALAEMVRDMMGMPPPLDAKELAALTRRLVAAACCCFLEGVKPTKLKHLERWTPYHNWVRQLGPTDTVVTFNYDTVLELLNESIRPPLNGHKRLNVVTDDYEEGDEQTPVFKLHGSVDWRRDESDKVYREKDGSFALRCEDGELALATPGPSKASTAHDLFEDLWKRAENKLRAADEVYFLGFRFPPSDAEARSRLLGAIEKNEQERIDLHVVLGSDRHSPDAVRLENLLEAYCMRGGRYPADDPMRGGRPPFKVHMHPLWVEDFLAVWHDEISIGPRKTASHEKARSTAG